MADLRGHFGNLVGVVSTIIFLSRLRDARLIPRLVLEQGSPEMRAVWPSAFALLCYERVVAAALRRFGLTRMPSTPAAMLSLFLGLCVQRQFLGKACADKSANLLRPGVEFLGRWMGVFLSPPLVSLDASIATLPNYSVAVWLKLASLLGSGWAATHSTAAFIASRLIPSTSLSDTHSCTTSQVQGPDALENKNSENQCEQAAKPVQSATPSISHEESVRRAWLVVCAASYIGVSCLRVIPRPARRYVGMLCQISTNVGSFALAKLLPGKMQRVLNPLVVCAVASNLSTRFVGPVAPFSDGGVGVGDLLYRLLPAAVTGLGVQMYITRDSWLRSSEDLKCVLAVCTVSGCFSLASTCLAAVSRKSPLALPTPLALPVLHRSVMSAIGIEGSKAVGPESDPKLAIASILITGCFGASCGNLLLRSCPAAFKSDSALVRGVSMGCSAHSIGTASLIFEKDVEAAAASGASMCLASTVHSLVLQLPGVVSVIRGIAVLPPLKR